MAPPNGAFSPPVIAFTENAIGGYDMRFQRGFTLIELVIVVAIVAILAAIALPMFTEQVRKGRRAEAMQALSDLQLRQERYRASHATYTTTFGAGGLETNNTIPSGYYTFTATTPASAGGCTCTTGSCYEFTATAAGAQANDAKCATIVLTNRCGVTSKTSTGGGECWR